MHNPSPIATIPLIMKTRDRRWSSRAALAAMLFASGCVSFAERPEITPARYAPASSDRSWNANPDVAVNHTPVPETMAALQPALPGAHTYDLDAMVDLALRNNPRTQSAWEAARTAASEFGAAQAPYYPQSDVEAANGYVRVPFELPGMAGAVNQWQAQPVVNVTYVLLDFGRRNSASTIAREHLIAANFAFNRVIQEVVFETQSAFYSLDGARAAVIASEKNLELSQTDFEAVRQRVDLGLATQPELLLAKERVAQSQFDLANARLLVHDAQANLAIALGIPANSDFRIESLESLPVPETLGPAVEALIDEARRQRPDLAARVANLRASEAQVSEARAQFFPTVGLAGSYGEDMWRFTFVKPPTVQTAMPQYSALLTLRWDLFTGFRHLNDMRSAESAREGARADLRSLEVDATAEVWRAYYEFESSLSKYQYAVSLLASAKEAYAANSETYRQGLSTIIELLTAQRDLANARYTLVQTKAELLTSSAAIAFAAGEVHAR